MKIKIKHIQLIIVVIGFGLIFTYLAGTFIYDQFFSPEYKVKLPFNDQHDSNLHITNVRAAKDPTFDQLLTFLENDDTEKLLAKEPDWYLGQCIAQLHDNAEKAGIRCGVVEVRTLIHSDTYALDVFNTVDYGEIMVDCSGGFQGIGQKSIVHMDTNKPHLMVFTPIEGTPTGFLTDTGNLSRDYSIAACFADIRSYTW